MKWGRFGCECDNDNTNKLLEKIAEKFKILEGNLKCEYDPESEEAHKIKMTSKIITTSDN